MEIGGLAEIEDFHIRVKVSGPSAKPTRPSVPPMHVGKALAMATEMLPLGADEVARNGAFGKKLRPEVFPNAPLQYSVCRPRCTPLSFPTLPESPPGNED